MNTELKFRAWDPQYKIMSPVTMILFSTNEIDTLHNGGEPKSMEHFKMMRYSGIEDSGGVEICAGDLRYVDGKLYKVVDDGWRFRFERNMVEFGENEDIILDEDTAYTSFLKGNVYENPELIQIKTKLI